MYNKGQTTRRNGIRYVYRLYVIYLNFPLKLNFLSNFLIKTINVLILDHKFQVVFQDIAFIDIFLLCV